jgi:hypothetical protein
MFLLSVGVNALAKDSNPVIVYQTRLSNNKVANNVLVRCTTQRCDNLAPARFNRAPFNATQHAITLVNATAYPTIETVHMMRDGRSTIVVAMPPMPRRGDDDAQDDVAPLLLHVAADDRVMSEPLFEPPFRGNFVKLDMSAGIVTCCYCVEPLLFV